MQHFNEQNFKKTCLSCPQTPTYGMDSDKNSKKLGWKS